MLYASLLDASRGWLQKKQLCPRQFWDALNFCKVGRGQLAIYQNSTFLFGTWIVFPPNSICLPFPFPVNVFVLALPFDILEGIQKPIPNLLAKIDCWLLNSPADQLSQRTDKVTLFLCLCFDIGKINWPNLLCLLIQSISCAFFTKGVL